jgi:hypothetical protein
MYTRVQWRVEMGGRRPKIFAHHADPGFSTIQKPFPVSAGVHAHSEESINVNTAIGDCAANDLGQATIVARNEIEGSFRPC